VLYAVGTVTAHPEGPAVRTGTGNTYRNPALLAKMITALDVVSRGRAQLGIGAGWYELEHDSLGFEFGTFTDRFARLEESLKIIIGMLRGEQPTVDGTWSRSSAPNCWRAASTA
jgi:alkanesulfonate monooxygenase SsuD/methylene tetrahydromethanopterin reductase-like flavin-dependent oxidoreductase (luciferase family)